MKLVNILIGGVNRPVPVDDVVLVEATGKVVDLELDQQ